MFVSSLLAAPQSGVKNNVANGLDVNSEIESLEQKLIHQSGAYDCRGRCRHVAKIVVIDVEVKALAGLQMDREIAAADAGSRTDAICGNAAWIVGNERVINRDCILE